MISWVYLNKNKNLFGESAKNLEIHLTSVYIYNDLNTTLESSLEE